MLLLSSIKCKKIIEKIEKSIGKHLKSVHNSIKVDKIYYINTYIIT